MIERTIEAAFLANLAYPIAAERCGAIDLTARGAVALVKAAPVVLTIRTCSLSTAATGRAARAGARPAVLGAVFTSFATGALADAIAAVGAKPAILRAVFASFAKGALADAIAADGANATRLACIPAAAVEFICATI